MSNPKYGMLSSFPQECFSFQNDLASYGLEPLISSFGPYYPDLVRVFFSNLTPQKGKMVTYVLGTRISLTPEVVGEILHIPYTGSSLYDPENKAWGG